MTIVIEDQEFLTQLYRRACRRSVHSRRSQQALRKRHVEVGWHPGYGEDIEVNICEGLGNATMEMGWHPEDGVTVICWNDPDAFIATGDHRALSAVVRAFLLKHDLIDERGKFVKRGAA